MSHTDRGIAEGGSQETDMTDRQVRISWLLVAILAGAATLGRAQTGGEIRFTDVTGIAGVALEGLTTESVAWGDYDNDGDEDLYLTNDGPNRLFRNDGNDRFTDVTATAGVGSAAFSVALRSFRLLASPRSTCFFIRSSLNKYVKGIFNFT